MCAVYILYGYFEHSKWNIAYYFLLGNTVDK